MLKMFNYRGKDDNFNALVDEALFYSAQQMQGKTI